MLVSLALHMLFVGSGIAFARLAGNLQRGHHSPMIVALIGREGTSISEKGANPTVPRSTERKRQAQRKAEPHEQTPVQPEPEPAPSPVAAFHEQVTQRPGQVSVSSQTEQLTASDSSGQSASPTSLPAGSQSGSVSPEQWALIVSSIERVKNYPRPARERGIEGVVLVRFRVLPSGEVQEVTIAKSSGAAILDEASVRTVQRAAPMPYVSGWIEVPMVYELK